MNAIRTLLGALCGVVATGPMTAAMLAWHRRLPAAEKYPLPPLEVTDAILEKAGVPASAGETSALAILAHFAYGGAAGALYGATTAPRRAWPWRAGLLLGTLVWSLSYFGLLPALHILRPAHKHPAQRSLLMLAAHWIWGGCLTALHALFVADSLRNTPALREKGAPLHDAAAGNKGHS
jgi:hypothetical protein